ncbi:YIP1 family protein [Rubrobacter aplysinae]|uniref:YIP1 family protein n=1 Tax=Rubrobacter aplysinae TaxID=909625 RepID=UPI00064C2A74|nr:YIP1 family protein [Rubrobacter aplysinae]
MRRRRGRREGGFDLERLARHQGEGRRSPEGLVEAAREVWLSPVRFFRHLDPEGGLIRPAVFAIVVLFLNLLLGDLLQALWLRDFGPELLRLPLLALAAAGLLGPALVALFAGLVLFVLDGAPSRERLGPAFRAFGYVSAIGLVLWIPFAPLAALPYAAYVAHVAVAETLGSSRTKAALAVLIPLGALLLILLMLTGPEELWTLFTNPPQS